MQADAVQRIHDGHQGIEKCKMRARTSVLWNGINNDLDIVKRCAVFQEHQHTNPRETLLPHELPTRSWQILGTDLFHYNNSEYLIVVDYYSKFSFVRKMPTPCTRHTVVAATADIFSEHGVKYSRPTPPQINYYFRSNIKTTRPTCPRRYLLRFRDGAD